jgi:GT2 family glycosyltransferase/glycosyltransferase involved in cell wall biosynthesis
MKRRRDEPGTARALLEFIRTAAQKASRAYREGRLKASPTRWLRDLKLHWEELAAARGSGRPPRAQSDAVAEARRVTTDACRAALREFLRSGARLTWPRVDEPRASVILVLHNRAELTLRCLRSLRDAASLEVVIVDNASSDETSALLDRLDGARVERSAENQGFLLAVNRAARLARGRHLVLLNNDAELLPGSLESALRTLEGEGAPDVGAVCGRLILPDGSLQEAGSIIFRDGTCLGYGRGDSPFAPAYAFERDVDFGSGALLATPRALYEELGGFDEQFKPAYYEDADYCVRVWRSGRRVVYDPGAVALHYEFASSSSPAQAVRLQAERRERFARKHADWLAAQPPLDPDDRAAAFRARTHRAPGSRGLSILFVDDRVPHARLGSGHPRAGAIARALAARGHRVTLYPTSVPWGDFAEIYRELPRTVEVMIGPGAAELDGFVAARRGGYDRVLVSRPHNLALVERALARLEPRPRVIYDAEAIFAARDGEAERRAGLAGAPSEGEIAARVAAELALARRADVVLSVCEGERRRFEAAGAARALTLGHAIAPAPGARPFGERAGFLFVGAFHVDTSPNSDSMFWFVGEVWPRLRAILDGARLTIAGARPTRRIANLKDFDIEIIENAAELAPLYDRARVAIAPTRFAAGLPYKVHEAAAHGVPVVATPLLAAQLGWAHDVELVAPPDGGAGGFAEACAALYRDRARWERLRAAALRRVERDCSPDAFAAALDAALE